MNVYTETFSFVLKENKTTKKNPNPTILENRLKTDTRNYSDGGKMLQCLRIQPLSGANT